MNSLTLKNPWKANVKPVGRVPEVRVRGGGALAFDVVRMV